MGTLGVTATISLDGYAADANGDCCVVCVTARSCGASEYQGAQNVALEAVE